VESDGRLLRVTFELLGERLLAFVRLRIKNGEYTERGLARILGVSQPQMHNVLKGARGLRPALADRLLRKFGITALELLTDAELNDAICTRSMARIAIDEGPEELRRWRKPAGRSARLNLRRDEKVV
jgi:plasmid maintenance system antidote protein VapI